MKNKDFPFYVIAYYYNGEFIAYSKHSVVQPYIAKTDSLIHAKKYKNKGSAIKRAKELRKIYNWDKELRIEVEKIVKPNFL